MKVFFASAILMVSPLSGCASLSSQLIEFRTANSIKFEVSNSQFDTIDVQPYETQLWLGTALVGSIMTMETNPAYSTAMEEVRQGFLEAKKSSGTSQELELADGAYGFATSISGYTTAFLAVSAYDGAWVTISVADELFDEVVSSLTYD